MNYVLIHSECLQHTDRDTDGEFCHVVLCDRWQQKPLKIDGTAFDLKDLGSIGAVDRILGCEYSHGKPRVRFVNCQMDTKLPCRCRR